MDINFADLKKEAAAVTEDVFNQTADVAKQATNAALKDRLGGGRESVGQQIDNSHTEHYFANEQKDLDFEHVDPQAFVQRMSAGAKEAQEQLDAKFAEHANDFDDFITNTAQDLSSFGQQLHHDTKQGLHDFMNAERGIFGGGAVENKPAATVTQPNVTHDTAPLASTKAENAAIFKDDLLQFGGNETAAPKETTQTFAPSAPIEAHTHHAMYDDELQLGKSTPSNKESDTDSPSISYNPSPAKKNPVSKALKEQDHEKFISSEDLLGDFKDERTGTPEFQNATSIEANKPTVATTAAVPVTDLDADEDFLHAADDFSEVKHSQVEDIKSSKLAPSVPAATANKPEAAREPQLASAQQQMQQKLINQPAKVEPLPKPTKTPNKDKQEHHTKIVSVEEIFYKYGLDAWFKPERLHPQVESLIYWRDVKKSGIFFGAGLVILLAISCFSVISVVAYLSLLTLAGTVAFRIYKSVMQAIQKTPDGHPFKEYLEFDLTLSQEKVQHIAGVVVAHLNGFTAELRRLFLVEDLVDSIKFGVILWVMTYIGGWFNGMTLVILAFVALFTLPKVYENNKQSIDTYLDLVLSKVREVSDKVKAAIPIGKKPIAAETDKDK